MSNINDETAKLLSALQAEMQKPARFAAPVPVKDLVPELAGKTKPVIQ